MRPSARPFPTGRFPPERLINEPLLASDVLPRSCRLLPIPPTDQYRSYRAVSRRRRWVERLFSFELHPKLTSCFIIFPPLQLPPRISSPRDPMATTLLPWTDINGIDLQRRQEGEFFVCFCFEPHPKLTNYFWVAWWCTSGRRQPRPSRVGGTSGWPLCLLVRSRIRWEGGRNNGKSFMLLHSFYWF
jgi:hypothetical protein